MSLERVLVATRGVVARRLVEWYRSVGTESVLVFSEADAEQALLDEADYAVYLNGRTVAETYMDVQRVVSAAVDAGCEAIHPGTCFLAERPDLYEVAMAANIAVVGADPRALGRVVDRSSLREVARRIGLPLIPASPPLAADDDGVAAGAQVGVPLFVKGVRGGAMLRVESLDALPEAVEAVRRTAAMVSGEPTVYLERAVSGVRQVGTVVVGDRHGTCVHLGETDSSLEHGYTSWVEEVGPEVVPERHQRLGEAAVRLAREVGWVGVGKVRWALTDDGGWYLLGYSARLTTGFDLVEAVQGVDLVETQHRALIGEPLRWKQRDAGVLGRHGIQLRILHLDPASGRRPEGRLERLDLPGEVAAAVGVDVGSACDEDTEPLLLKLTVTAPTRSAAVVQARRALDELVVEGVPTNVEALRALLGSEPFRAGHYDTGTLARQLG